MAQHPTYLVRMLEARGINVVAPCTRIAAQICDNGYMITAIDKEIDPAADYVILFWKKHGLAVVNESRFSFHFFVSAR